MQALSGEAIKKAERAQANGDHWAAYNTAVATIELWDLFFFKLEKDAHVFAARNVGEDLFFHVLPTNAIIQIKNEVMNEKNYDYLVNQLRGTGFGETHAEELKQKIEKGETDFGIFHQQSYGRDEAVATLHFRKSNESDMFFFNRYTLALKKADASELVKQTFYVNPKEDTVTMKEAYNLLSGRAIEKELTPKEGEKYMAWLQLDFKQQDKHENYVVRSFHPNYGFDLVKSLEKMPIKELAVPEHRERLMASLQRGNRQQVTLQLGDKEVKISLEAAPQFKAVNLYDATMRRTTMQAIRDGAGEKVNNTAQHVSQAAANSPQQDATKEGTTQQQAASQQQGNRQVKSSKQSLNDDGGGVGEGGQSKQKKRRSQHL